MKYWLVTAILLLGFPAWAETPQAENTTNKHEIEAASDAWRAAYDSRNPKKILSRYTPDAVFWGTTAKEVASTPAGLTHYFKNSAARPHARVIIGEQHVRIYGDVATSAGQYTFTGMRDGKKVSYPARFSFVFRKLDGQWLIAQHHSSQLPE